MATAYVLMETIKAILEKIPCEDINLSFPNLFLETQDIQGSLGVSSMVDFPALETGYTKSELYNRLSEYLAVTPPPGLLEKMIGEISVVLTPVEICDLYEGSGSGEILNIALTVARLGTYEPFHETFQTTDDVAHFFKMLGRIVCPSYCESIRNIPNAEDICKTPDYDEIRSSLLSNKEDITDEEVASQIARHAERRQAFIDQTTQLLKSEF